MVEEEEEEEEDDKAALAVEGEGWKDVDIVIRDERGNYVVQVPGLEEWEPDAVEKGRLYLYSERVEVGHGIYRYP